MRNRNPPGIRVDDRLGMTTTTDFRLLPFRGVRFNLSATRQATVPHDSTCPIGRAHRTTLYDLQVVGNAIEASSSPEHVEASRMPWPEPDSWKGSSPSGRSEERRVGKEWRVGWRGRLARETAGCRLL